MTSKRKKSKQPKTRSQFSKVVYRRTTRMLHRINNSLDSVKSTIHVEARRVDQILRDNDKGDHDEPVVNLFRQEGEIHAMQTEITNALQTFMLTDSSSESDVDVTAPVPASLRRSRITEASSRAILASDSDEAAEPQPSTSQGAGMQLTPLGASQGCTQGARERRQVVIGSSQDPVRRLPLAAKRRAERSAKRVLEASVAVIPDTEGITFDGKLLLPDNDRVKTVIDDDEEFSSGDPPGYDYNLPSSEVDSADETYLEPLDEEELSDEEDTQMEAVAVNQMTMAGPNGDRPETQGMLADNEDSDDDVAIVRNRNWQEPNDDVGPGEALPPEELEVDGSLDATGALRLNYKTFRAISRRTSHLSIPERNKILFDLFDSIAIRTCTSDKAVQLFYDLTRAQNEMSSRDMPHIDKYKREADEKAPKVLMDYEIKNLTTGEVIKLKGEKKFPQKAYPRKNFKRISEYAYCTIADIYEHAKANHEAGTKLSRSIIMFVDGLPWSKSGSYKLDVISIKIPPCNEVFTMGMHIYAKESCLDINTIVEMIIQSFGENDFKIGRVVGDAPVRAELAGIKSHSGMYSCLFCVAKGQNYQHRQVFGPETKAARLRTDFWYKEMAKRIQRDDIASFSPDELFGMKAATPLVLLDGFSVIKDLCLEPMHNISGCAKQLIRSMMGFSEKYKSKKHTIVQMGLLHKFDARWQDIALPREFNRRTRTMNDNFVQYKTQEIMSIVVCGFLAFGEAFSGELYTGYVETWYTFCYIVRACLFDDDMFQWIDSRCSIIELQCNFYEIFHDNFGLVNCSWNIHTFFHLHIARQLHRLPQISALGFEGDLSHVKRNLKPGTRSVPKQIMRKVFKRSNKIHSCENRVTFSTVEISRHCDDIVYTKNRQFFRISHVTGENYIGKHFMTECFATPQAPDLNWSLIGVFKWVGVDHESEVVIPKRDCIAKGIVDEKYLIAVPFDSFFT